MSDRIPLPRPGQGADKARMDEILRVDHAGEYAAVLIYRAQRAVFEARKGREAITRDLGEMQDQEAVHLARFERLLNERKVRPTAMTPVWRLAASALGAGTALIGEKVEKRIESLAKAFGLSALPGESDRKAFTVIWTTTAWTIPANQALNLNPTLTYALVDTERGLMLCAQSLVEACLARWQLHGQVLATCVGEALDHIAFHHPRQPRHGA